MKTTATMKTLDKKRARLAKLQDQEQRWEAMWKGKKKPMGPYRPRLSEIAQLKAEIAAAEAKNVTRPAATPPTKPYMRGPLPQTTLDGTGCDPGVKDDRASEDNEWRPAAQPVRVVPAVPPHVPLLVPPPPLPVKSDGPFETIKLLAGVLLFLAVCVGFVFAMGPLGLIGDWILAVVCILALALFNGGGNDRRNRRS